MKKKVFLIVSIVIILLISLFLSTGKARTDVYLKNFELSNDGKTMTLNVGISSSTGYIRKIKRTNGSMNYYYTFYSTFGINSKLGAKDSFKIELDSNAYEIYFYTGDKGYKKVLEKNTNAKWIKTENKYDEYNLVENLKSNDYASTEMLVKFNGVLYGKSYAIIDYEEPPVNKIGTIDKLIDNKYVPKLNNETNSEKLLNAVVFDKTIDSIVIYYDNEYVLFRKIDE